MDGWLAGKTIDVQCNLRTTAINNRGKEDEYMLLHSSGALYKEPAIPGAVLSSLSRGVVVVSPLRVELLKITITSSSLSSLKWAMVSAISICQDGRKFL